MCVQKDSRAMTIFRSVVWLWVYICLFYFGHQMVPWHIFNFFKCNKKSLVLNLKCVTFNTNCIYPAIYKSMSMKLAKLVDVGFCMSHKMRVLCFQHTIVHSTELTIIVMLYFLLIYSFVHGFWGCQEVKPYSLTINSIFFSSVALIHLFFLTWEMWHLSFRFY